MQDWVYGRTNGRKDGRTNPFGDNKVKTFYDGGTKETLNWVYNCHLQ